MKRKSIRRAAVIIVALALISAALLSYTMSEYSSAFNSGMTTLVAAKWEIDVENTNTVTVENSTLKVKPTINRAAIYAEDFEAKTNGASADVVDDLGWSRSEITDITGTYENGAFTMQTVDDNAVNKNVFVPKASMKDIKNYSIEFDFQFPSGIANNAKSPVLGVMFNTAGNGYDDNKTYMRMDIRPEQSNGVYNRIGVRILNGNKGGDIGTWKLDNAVYFGGGNPIGTQHRCRMDVNNVTGSIRVYINDILAYEYIHQDVAATEDTLETNGTVRVHKALMHKTVKTNDKGILETTDNNVILWSQWGSVTIDDLNVYNMDFSNDTAPGVSAAEIVPGTGGKLAEVKINNKSEVAAKFILVLEATAHSDGLIPRNFELLRGADTSGDNIAATTSNGGKQIIFTGELALPDTEGGSTEAVCDIEWLWEYKNSDKPSMGNDMFIGDATDEIIIDVSIKEFRVVQINPSEDPIVPLEPTVQNYSFALLEGDGTLHIYNRFLDKDANGNLVLPKTGDIYSLSTDNFVTANTPAGSKGEWNLLKTFDDKNDDNNDRTSPVKKVIVEDYIELVGGKNKGGYQLFHNFTACEEMNLQLLDTSKATSMAQMFESCKALTSLDLSGFNTENVQGMNNMFSACNALTSLNLSGFNTQNVTNMSQMFSGGWALTSLDVSGFDTSKVRNMSLMFDRCRVLTSLDVSEFDTASAEYMNAMFRDCKALTSLDVSDFNTLKVIEMKEMFNGCSALTSLDLSSFSSQNLTTVASMFSGCSKLETVKFGTAANTIKLVQDTNKKAIMDSMFRNCQALTSLDLSGFNTENVTTMAYMFYDCQALEALNVQSFNTENVTNMSYMFGGLHTLENLNIRNFATGKVTTMKQMFAFNYALESLLFDSANFDTSKVTDMSFMFHQCYALAELDLSGFDTAKVESMGYMFYNCEALTSIYVSNSFTTTAVGTSAEMFNQCYALKGGNGTTYSDSNPQDKTYARIDGGPNSATPGYFTAK